MTKQFELLAPGGDMESIKAAIVAGADAIYCGLGHFNACNRATNIEIGDLNQVLHLAHAHQCKVFLTINILIIENEFKSLINLLNKLVNTTLDGIIVQDFGLLHLLAIHFKGLEVHASTQLTTHNSGQIQFLDQLAVKRVNLCRELNIEEIKALVDVGRQRGISIEVFVHGSYCIGFSGLCYLSSVLAGKSGNRGRCSQHCRDAYQATPKGIKHPLNLKDNSAFNDLALLAEARVDALKIEGRMKRFDYVYTVVNSWRKLLDNFYASGQTHSADSAIYQVFNRTFSNGFLLGDINQDMFIDNPRDSSARHFKGKNDWGDGDHEIKNNLRAARTVIMEDARREIATLPTKKVPAKIKLSGEAVELPRLEPLPLLAAPAKLAVLISSAEQIALCDHSTATIYYQLPCCLQDNVTELVELFRQHKQLVPWFPALLIGDHYHAAVELLRQLQPEQIVSNNSGIGYAAYQLGIAWIAGPHLNCINSYSLLCLKQRFNCAGAFISNELSREQISLISRPEGFDLYYSVYHPLMLLTSRQCLLHQIEDCEKSRIDDDCLQNCTRTATITNEKKDTLVVHNSKGGYPSLYHSRHFLNSDIIADLPTMFSGFLIDLIVIENDTTVSVNQTQLIALFNKLLAGDRETQQELERVVQRTTNAQYFQGI